MINTHKRFHELIEGLGYGDSDDEEIDDRSAVVDALWELLTPEQKQAFFHDKRIARLLAKAQNRLEKEGIEI